MKKSIIVLALLTLAATAQTTFATGGGLGGNAPDGGSTALMLTAGVAGLGYCWKRLRK